MYNNANYTDLYGLGVAAGALHFYANAQANSAPKMTLNASGNLGIGTDAPGAKLQVNDDSPDARNGVVSWLTRSGSGDVGLSFSQVGTNSYGIVHLAGTGTTGGGLGFYHDRWPGGAGRLDMLIDNSGNVLIGNNKDRYLSPTLAAKKALYGLWVEKGVVAKDFAIAEPGTWADFVFAPGYRLAPLAETEAYIRQHGHLPGMPSAQDVHKDGYSVHEMNTRLLQQIEELTLHSIEQEKRFAALQAQTAKAENKAVENAQAVTALTALMQQYAAEVAQLKAQAAK